MIRKFFPRDKNYVLEEAQLSLKDTLLEYVVDFVKVEYLLQHNPLGLIDETVSRIQNHKNCNLGRLDEFYIVLAGIYRYKYYADNQLEFIFENEEPWEIYRRTWAETVKAWAKEFVLHHNFIMGILELTVFYPHQDEAMFIGNRLKTFLSNYFEVSIHSDRGIYSSASKSRNHG